MLDCVDDNLLALLDVHNVKFVAGSRVGYFLLPLSIALQDDPLDCIWKAKASIDRRKLSHEASISFFLSAFVQN